MLEFRDTVGRATLSVEPAKDAIRLGIHWEGESIFFYMNPNDFGEVAAALWECSPTKQPIKVTSTTDEEDATRRVDEAQMGLFEDSPKDSKSLGAAQGSEAKGQGGATETTSTRDGAGPQTDPGTDSRSATGS